MRVGNSASLWAVPLWQTNSLNNFMCACEHQRVENKRIVNETMTLVGVSTINIKDNFFPSLM